MQQGDPVEVQGAEHNRNFGLDPPDPTHSHRRTDAVGGGVRGIANLSQFARLGEDGIHLGQEIMGRPRDFFQGSGAQFLARRNHRRVEAVGQFYAGLGRSIVVLSRPDVAGTSGEIEMGASRLGRLEPLPGETDEITADLSLPVVTHGMTGIIMTGRDLFFAAVKSHRFQLRINESLR